MDRDGLVKAIPVGGPKAGRGYIPRPLIKTFPTSLTSLTRFSFARSWQRVTQMPHGRQRVLLTSGDQTPLRRTRRRKMRRTTMTSHRPTNLPQGNSSNTPRRDSIQATLGKGKIWPVKQETRNQPLPFIILFYHAGPHPWKSREAVVMVPNLGV